MYQGIEKYGFKYNNGVLYWNSVSLKEIAERFGTPLFVFSADEFRKRLRLFKQNVDYDHLLCFSVKSNNNHFLVSEVKNEEYGIDVVSGGELFLAKKVGIDPKKIVFSGVGKTNEEIMMAQSLGILLLNIESESEYKFVRDLSRKNSLNFGLSFRVKFEISLDKLHPYLGVGKKDSKFGINSDLAFELYKDAQRNDLPVQGIHFHLGSQIKDMEIFKLASEICLDFVEKLRSEKINLKYVDVGGGLGIDYENLEEPDIREYINCFRKIGERYKVIFELGRYLSAPSGILISKVIRKKLKEGSKNFLVVDAGMTEILRVPLYKAYHRVLPVSFDENRKEKKFDIVGPICENSDYIAQDIDFPDVEEGEFICVLYAGAYTSTMLSNYNGRPFPAEVVIKDEKCFLTRKRQTFEDMFSRDLYE